MKITREDLIWAASTNIVTEAQADALWHALEKRGDVRPRFDLAHLAYYFGALIVMSAMGWFMTLAWENFGGGGICAIAVLYAVGFVLAGRTLWHSQLKVPGGLLITLAVWMTPLVIYGLERTTGIWPQGDPGTYRDFHIWVKGSWLLMEVGTILVGVVALRFVRFPFLTFPIAFALWYMSMDLTPLLFGKEEFAYNERLWVSAWFGLAMLTVAYLIDRRTQEDFSFWGYLFGLLAFLGGLSLMDSGSQLNRFLYCLINVGLMLLSVLLQRRVFIVFGALGVFGYLSYLSYDVFKDSMLFPFALSFLGVLIIALGVGYQRKREAIERGVMNLVPAGIQSMLPKNRPRP
jgi:hypothetical protein